jgi:Oxidoreductase family, NAD-binding Rossmann fold
MKLRPSILFAIGCLAARGFGADLRLGVIGTDTSHAVAFAGALNDPTAVGHVLGARIVVAFKGGSPEIEESRSRVEKFAGELRDKFGVRFVSNISDMCGAVDGILIESVDGRTHLAQMKEAVKCHKPVFVDKPLASSLSDAREMARIADESHIPWFSASSLRFSAIESLKEKSLNGAIVWGPGPTEEHQLLDLTWYGIHAAEMLYTLMGQGCSEVTRTNSAEADVVTCRWKDGRLGVLRVDRPYSKFGAVAFRAKNQVDVLPDIKVDYLPLVRQILQFMTTRRPPVANAETLEIFQMMDAAQKSKEQGGKPVTM